MLVKPQLPPNYEDETWDRLKRAVHAIQNHEKVPESLETLYKVRKDRNAWGRLSTITGRLIWIRILFKSCENLCHHKMADRLYTRLREECGSHVVKELGKLNRYLRTCISITYILVHETKNASVSNQTTGIFFLETVSQTWANYCNQMVSSIVDHWWNHVRDW